MNLRPIDGSEIPLVAEWLSRKENYQWLDFGDGTQILNVVSLKIMLQRDLHLLRIITSDSEDAPIGLVALSNINRNFRTAVLWYVLGDKRYGGQGYMTRAVSKFLTIVFGELGLQAVNAWVVEGNLPSVRILERNNFRPVGSLRKCHYIDDQPSNRLLFDLLASEHKEI